MTAIEKNMQRKISGEITLVETYNDLIITTYLDFIRQVWKHVYAFSYIH